MIKMIAICGQKRSGKDTIANIICDNYPNYKNVKISGHLKDTLKLLFNFNDEQIEGDLKDIKDDYWDIEPRKLMQFIGTEIMQYEIQKVLPNIDRKFWIKTFINKYIKECINDSNKLIVTDLRFIHEYDELKKHNFIIIKVENNNLTNNDDHISETEYLKIPSDYIIKNNGTIKDLKINIHNVMSIIIRNE